MGMTKEYGGGENGTAEEACTIFVQLFGMLMQSFSTVANVLVVSVLTAVLVATSCVCMEI